MTQEEIEVKEKVIGHISEMYDEVWKIASTGDQDKMTGYAIRLAQAAAKEDTAALTKLALMNIISEKL